MIEASYRYMPLSQNSRCGISGHGTGSYKTKEASGRKVLPSDTLLEFHYVQDMGTGQADVTL